MYRVDHAIIQGLHWTEVPLLPGAEHPHLAKTHAVTLALETPMSHDV